MRVQQATMLAMKVLSAFASVCQTPAGLLDEDTMDVISKESVKSCHITNSSHGLLHARVLIACLLRCASSPTCCLNTVLIVQISFRVIRDQFVIALVRSV